MIRIGYTDYQEEDIVVFDLETTGLVPGNDEILQISIADGNGKELLNEYVKPDTRQRWPKAQEIHHISPAMVKDKPSIMTYVQDIRAIFAQAKVIVSYNGSFDEGFLEEIGAAPPASLPRFDVMKEFAPIYGKWDAYHGDYKWQKLTTCAKYYGYKYSEGNEAHDSMVDVQATLYCFKKMMEEQEKQSVEKIRRQKEEAKRQEKRKEIQQQELAEILERSKADDKKTLVSIIINLVIGALIMLVCLGAGIENTSVLATAGLIVVIVGGVRLYKFKERSR